MLDLVSISINFWQFSKIELPEIYRYRTSYQCSGSDDVLRSRNSRPPIKCHTYIERRVVRMKSCSRSKDVCLKSQKQLNHQVTMVMAVGPNMLVSLDVSCNWANNDIPWRRAASYLHCIDIQKELGKSPSEDSEMASSDQPKQQGRNLKCPLVTTTVARRQN